MKAKRKTSVAASILVATSLVFGAAPANSAFGSKIKKAVTPVSDNQDLHIKYVGESEGFVYLRITLNQQKEQKSILEITDAKGENLYSENVTVKNFSKMIKIAPEELKTLQVTFTANGKQVSKSVAINTSFTTSYEVSEVAE